MFRKPFGVKKCRIPKSIEYKLGTIKTINNNTFFKYYINPFKFGENIHKKYKSKKIEKKSLNILYYDENLNNEENSDICAFISMNIDGTFYGCHYFELFKIVLEKIKNTEKNFIIICSDSSSKKIFNFFSNINIISRYYIFCYNKK